jgi:hypothetical protein
MLHISTVGDPIMMESGGPTQIAISPITAAGLLVMSTVTAVTAITGPPTCGIGGTPGVIIGQT